MYHILQDIRQKDFCKRSFPPRLATKATTLIQDLGKLSDEICEVNSAGLAEGHTPEQLSLLQDLKFPMCATQEIYE